MDVVERRRKKDDFLDKLRQTPKELQRAISLDGFPMHMCILLRDFVHPQPGMLFNLEEWVAGKNVGRVLVPK